MPNVADRGGCSIMVGTSAIMVYASGIVLTVAWVTGLAYNASSFGVAIGIIAVGIMICIFENTRGWNTRAKQNKLLALEKQDEDNIRLMGHIIRQCQIILFPVQRKERVTDEDIQSVFWFLYTQIDYMFSVYGIYITEPGIDSIMRIREDVLKIFMRKIAPTRQNVTKILTNFYELEYEIRDKDDHELKKIRDMASG